MIWRWIYKFDPITHTFLSSNITPKIMVETKSLFHLVYRLNIWKIFLCIIPKIRVTVLCLNDKVIYTTKYAFDNVSDTAIANRTVTKLHGKSCQKKKHWITKGYNLLSYRLSSFKYIEGNRRVGHHCVAFIMFQSFALTFIGSF